MARHPDAAGTRIFAKGSAHRSQPRGSMKLGLIVSSGFVATPYTFTADAEELRG
jgi:hypothetical protein